MRYFLFFFLLNLWNPLCVLYFLHTTSPFRKAAFKVLNSHTCEVAILLWSVDQWHSCSLQVYYKLRFSDPPHFYWVRIFTLTRCTEESRTCEDWRSTFFTILLLLLQGARSLPPCRILDWCLLHGSHLRGNADARVTSWRVHALGWGRSQAIVFSDCVQLFDHSEP